MKKITVITFSFLMLFALTKCNNTSPDTLSSNADTRAKTISALINNEAYMIQVMDSMQTKHPDLFLSNIFIMAKSNSHMQEEMIDKITDSCKGDTTLTKMMVGKTMNMLDESNLDCCTTGKMLMGEEMAMTHGSKDDCCKNGKMMTGHIGEMNAVDKLSCCISASKKSSSKAK